MSRKNSQSRTWGFLLTLGVPLTIVGVSAMAISYATLIDVARVNGLPLPQLFPVLVDVGTVAAMIAAAQFRIRGIKGRWLAYLTFFALSLISIMANASHASTAADMTKTTPIAAAVLAATPPAALLTITHLVMMLIPDEKERKKLAQLKELKEAQEAKARNEALVVQASAPVTPTAITPPSPPVPVKALKLVDEQSEVKEELDEVAVLALVNEFFEENQKYPSGAQVGRWLGKSAKTGQRFLAKMKEDQDQMVLVGT